MIAVKPVGDLLEENGCLTIPSPLLTRMVAKPSCLADVDDAIVDGGAPRNVNTDAIRD
jgi:hypothetical protein